MYHAGPDLVGGAVLGRGTLIIAPKWTPVSFVSTYGGSITSSSLVQTPSSIEMPQLFGSESYVKTVMQANWPG